MKDLISVIIPVYNVEKYIDNCLESIINQTYKNLEIILVDDGSTDNSGKICDDYALKDSRIKVIHKNNGGLSDARNKGLDVATGDFVSFIDSDDTIALDMYEVLHNRLLEDKTDIAVTKISWGDNKNNESNNNFYISEKDDFFGALNFNVSACNRLYNIKLWKNIRFPFGKLCEDAFVEHKITGQCDRISCIERCMYFYLAREGSIMHKTYTVNRLDGAEAYLSRLEFMLDNQFIKGAESAFYCVMRQLREARQKLDLSNVIARDRLISLEKRAKEIFHKRIIKFNFPISTKIRLGIFYFCPKIYAFTNNSKTYFKRFLRR